VTTGRIAAYAAVLFIVAASEGGLAGAVPTDDWTALRRSLHVPKIKPGARCPVARAAEVVDGQALNGRDPALLSGVGGAPAGVIALGYLDAKGWRGQKTPWLVPLTYGGPVLVRGTRIDRLGPVRFAKGFGQHLIELRYAAAKATEQLLAVDSLRPPRCSARPGVTHSR
jgi:hypothetical protein